MPDQAPPPAAPDTAPSPATTAPPADRFVRFVRAVRDKPVTRFVVGPGGAPRAGRLFGAERIDGVLAYDTKAVHAITEDEWESFGRVYQRNIRDGDLVELKREDFDAYCAAKRAVRDKARADAAKASAPAEGAPENGAADEVVKDSSGPASPAGGEVS